MEKMVAKLRAVPLGFDRNHRRYWFWPAAGTRTRTRTRTTRHTKMFTRFVRAGPRLWVETPPASFYDSLGIRRPPSLQADEKPADEHKGEEDKSAALQNGDEEKESKKNEEKKIEEEGRRKKLSFFFLGDPTVYCTHCRTRGNEGVMVIQPRKNSGNAQAFTRNN